MKSVSRLGSTRLECDLGRAPEAAGADLGVVPGLPGVVFALLLFLVAEALRGVAGSGDASSSVEDFCDGMVCLQLCDQFRDTCRRGLEVRLVAAGSI